MRIVICILSIHFVCIGRPHHIHAAGDSKPNFTDQIHPVLLQERRTNAQPFFDHCTMQEGLPDDAYSLTGYTQSYLHDAMERRELLEMGSVRKRRENTISPSSSVGRVGMTA